MPALLVPKTRVASAARVNKPTAPAVPVYFPKNILNSTNTSQIEIELPQMYTFSKKYPECLVIVMHHEKSDKQFFVKQPAREDDNSDGSKNEDLS